MNPADQQLLYDYGLSMLDDGPPEDVDDKLLRWMAVLRECEPRLGFFYGSRRRPNLVNSREDLVAARAWFRSKMRSPEDYDGTSVLLFVATGRLASNVVLDVHPVIDSRFQWQLTLPTALLRDLIGVSPSGVAELFRALVSITRPCRAEWLETRNHMVVCCGFYEKRLEGLLPPWLPRSYPEEAVPYRSLLLPPEFSFRYPACVWWHNYWCREIVDEIGRSVVLTTPAAQVVEAPDGGVFIHLCNEPFTIDRPDHLLAQRRAVEHLNLRALQVKHANPLYYGKFGTGGTK